MSSETDSYQVLYRVITDFSAFTRAATKAREELKQLKSAQQSYDRSVVEGSAKEVVARSSATKSIEAQRVALEHETQALREHTAAALADAAASRLDAAARKDLADSPSGTGSRPGSGGGTSGGPERVIVRDSSPDRISGTSTTRTVAAPAERAEVKRIERQVASDLVTDAVLRSSLARAQAQIDRTAATTPGPGEQASPSATSSVVRAAAAAASQAATTRSGGSIADALGQRAQEPEKAAKPGPIKLQQGDSYNFTTGKLERAVQPQAASAPPAAPAPAEEARRTVAGRVERYQALRREAPTDDSPIVRAAALAEHTLADAQRDGAKAAREVGRAEHEVATATEGATRVVEGSAGAHRHSAAAVADARRVMHEFRIGQIEMSAAVVEAQHVLAGHTLAIDQDARAARKSLASKRDEEQASYRMVGILGTLQQALVKLGNSKKDADGGSGFMKDLGRGLDEAKSKINSFAGAFLGLFKISALAALVAPIVTALMAAGAAAIGFGTDLASMGGLALAAGPALAALVTGVGALFLAFKSVGGVFKDYTAQQQAVRQAQQTSAQNAMQLRDAEVSLGNAQQAVTNAQISLNEARKQATRDLIDLREAVKNQPVNELSAVAGLQKAKEDYLRTMASTSATLGDREAATAGVAQAEIALNDTRKQGKRNQEDLNVANARGVDGNRSVVAAQQALVSAQYGVVKAQFALIQAQKEYAAGSAAALSATNKFQADLKRLSPTARAFVLGLIAQKGAWKDLRNVVQENFFGKIIGHMGKIRQLAPILTGVLGKAASALGGVFARLLDKLTSPAWKRDFNTFGTQNAKLLTTMGDNGTTLLHVLMRLVLIAGPFTQKLAEAFGKGATNLDKLLSSRAGSERLAKWLELVRLRAHLFWVAIKNLGAGMLSLAHVATGFNTGLLVSLDTASKHFRDWAAAQEKAGTRGKFYKYLQDIKPLLHQIGQFLKDLTIGLGHIGSDPRNIATTTSIFAKLRDLIPGLVKVLSDFGNSGILQTIVDAFKSVLALVQSLKDLGFFSLLHIIGTTISGMAHVVSMIAQITSHVPGMTAVIKALAVALGVLAGAAIIAKFTGLLALFRLVSGVRAGTSILNKLPFLARGATGAAGAAAAGAVGAGAVAASRAARGAGAVGAAGAASRTGAGAVARRAARVPIVPAGGRVRPAGAGPAPTPFRPGPARPMNFAERTEYRRIYGTNPPAGALAGGAGAAGEAGAAASRGAGVLGRVGRIGGRILGGRIGVASIAGLVAGSYIDDHKAGSVRSQAGGALKGAATGAALGSLFGGVPGALVGGLVGGLIGWARAAGKTSEAQKNLNTVTANGKVTQANFALAVLGGGRNLKKHQEATALAALAQTTLTEKAAKAGLTQKDLTNAITGTDEQFQRVIQTWKDSGHPSQKTLEALMKLREQFQGGAKDARTYADANEIVLAGDVKHAKLTDVLSGKVANLNTAHLTGREASNVFKASLDGLSTSVAANGTSLDKNTSFGKKNRDAIRAAAAAALAHAQAVYQSEVKTRGTTKAMQDAEATLAADRRSFRHAADAAGLHGKAVEDVYNSLFKINHKSPYKATIDVNTNYAVQKTQDFGNWFTTYLQLLGRKTPALPTPTANPDGTPIIPGAGHTSAADLLTGGLRAGGGEIFGRGSSRSDSNLTRTSVGEFVVNAADYGRNKRAVQAINAGRPKEALAALAQSSGFLNDLSSGRGLGVLDSLLASHISSPSANGLRTALDAHHARTSLTNVDKRTTVDKGIQIDRVEINYPKPETSGDSIRRTVEKMNFMAGRVG